ncbi:NF-kappa-B inhibitor zeta-like [Anneissia japonica]|uniref:NF-kappa-B inhibitor zeta-like n=1 Tax=Anneissia japonica TaxID=1529436 RepID=UPI0014257214|nr:NF-kappa-B inhibitor zeta-like [Anneissia japonica]
MQSLSEKPTLKTVVKAEVAGQETLSNTGKNDKSQMKMKTDLKLHTAPDFDPGYNSLDSDGGSPISSSKKPYMKMSKEDKVKECAKSPKSEQSIEQNLVDKIRRRAASIGDDPSTPTSFLQLHLETVSNQRNSSIENSGIKGETNKTSAQISKDLKLDENKVKEKKSNTNDEEVNALADKLNKTVTLIPKGLHEKRGHDRIPVIHRQNNLYAPLNQIPPILPVTSDGGEPKKRCVYIPGGNVVPVGSNLKPPSSQRGMVQNVYQDPRFAPQMTANQWNQSIDMMFQQAQVPGLTSIPNTQPRRPFEISSWPHHDDFPATSIPSQFQSANQFSQEAPVISVQTASNTGIVHIKEEPPSPLAAQHTQPSTCQVYVDHRSPEEAIKDIVEYLKKPAGSPSPHSVPSPQASISSPYSQPTEQYFVDPLTPPPSVGSSYSPNSPVSVMSEEMPVSPPQVSSPTQVPSPQQMEPVRDDYTMGIMECEQEVNRLSIQCLMEQDAEDKDTCLHVVVTQGRYNLAIAIAKKLSQVPGALNIQNNLGQTPVFLATVVNMPYLVIELISLGADPSIKDRSGCTPMHYAAMKGFTTIVRAIHIGLQNSNRLQDFDVDSKDYDGKTPLHYAIEHHQKFETVFTAESQCATQIYVENKDLVAMLLFMHASTTGQDGKSGKTPLHYAVEHQKIDLIDIILESDQSCVNKQTFAGCTPLHLAVGLKAEEPVIEDIVRRLMRNGADVSKENFEKEKAIGINPKSHLSVRNLLSGRS